MTVVRRYIEILTVGVFHYQDSFPSKFRPRLWETSSGVVVGGVFAVEARRELRRGEGILRMKNADNQYFNIPTVHDHLTRNCLMKIITPTVKALMPAHTYAVRCGASRRGHIGNSSGHAAWCGAARSGKSQLFQNGSGCFLSTFM